jgi:hypothetical protein
VVARPDGVCPQERPACTESSGVVAVVDTASRHATASVAAVQQAVSTHPVWRPGSGCPAVRCPVTWGRRPEGPAVGRLLSTRPVSSCPVSIRAVSSRLVSALVGPDASVSSHSGGGGGDQVEVAGDRDHRNGWRPRWLPSRRRLDRRSQRPGRGDAAEVALVTGRSVAVPGRRVGCGPRRPCLPTQRPGRPGRRSERPWRAAARWAREQAARGGGSRRVAAVLGLGA